MILRYSLMSVDRKENESHSDFQRGGLKENNVHKSQGPCYLIMHILPSKKRVASSPQKGHPGLTSSFALKFRLQVLASHAYHERRLEELLSAKHAFHFSLAQS